MDQLRRVGGFGVGLPHQGSNVAVDPPPPDRSDSVFGSPEEDARCDQESYLTRNRAGGCVFSAVKQHWRVSINGNGRDFQAVAAHILCQQKTLPGNPGVYATDGSGNPLTRMYNPTDKERNRSKAARECGKYKRPVINGVKYTCDEYPFASTYQGCVTGKNTYAQGDCDGTLVAEG